MRYNDSEFVFMNPYNFKRVDTTNKINGNINGKNTGVLHCTLKTVTPLCVPDVETKRYDEWLLKNKNIKHPIYDFFRENNKLAIPGSTLRGSIRSMYEAITDSCFVTADIKAPITYRSNKPFEPGILKFKDGKWILNKATRYLVLINDYQDKKACFKKDVDVCKEDLEPFKALQGNIVSFNPLLDADGNEMVYEFGGITVGTFTKSYSLNEEGTKKGIVNVDEPFPKKNFESIFYDEEIEKASGEIVKNAVEALDIIHEMYNDSTVNISLNKRDEKEIIYPYRNFEQAKEDGTSIPIWYKVNNGKLYLSFAQIGRSAYSKKMGELLNKKVPCTNRKDVCKACALFGMATDEENGSLGSKVRISDAYINGNCKPSLVTLKELASPKPSYLPFYVDKRKSNWNEGYDGEGTSIKGRKFYWHNTYENAYVANTNQKGFPVKTKRNATMQIVGDKSPIEFKFDVYFDQVTEEQLKELIGTLALGENNINGKQCYKIGHGKSIGLGSAKIKVDSVMIREFKNGEYRYDSNEEILKSALKSFKLPEEIKIITNVDVTKDYEISYPAIVDQDGNNFKSDKNDFAAHKWFNENYKLGKSKPESELVPITENLDDQLLWFKTPVFKKKSWR